MQMLFERHKQVEIKYLLAFKVALVPRHRIPCLLSVHKKLHHPHITDASEL